MQACDHFLWALQRSYERGEVRFLNARWPQFVGVIDMDPEAKQRRGKPRERGVILTKENPPGRATRAGLGAGSKFEPGGCKLSGSAHGMKPDFVSRRPEFQSGRAPCASAASLYCRPALICSGLRALYKCG